MKDMKAILGCIFFSLCFFLLFIAPVHASELTGTWAWQAADGQQEAKDWASFSSPGRPDVPSGTKHIWLKTELPQELSGEMALCFVTIDQDVRIWQDGKIVYEYGLMEQPVHGQHTHVVLLEESSKGKPLLFELYSENPQFLGNLQKTAIRPAENLVSRMVWKNFPLMASIPLMIYMLIMLREYEKSSVAQKSLYHYLRIFFGTFLVWLISASELREISFLSGFLWLVFRITFYLIPLAGFRLLYELLDKKYKPNIRYIVAAWGILLALAILLELTGLHGLDVLLPLYYLMILLAGGAVLYWTWESAQTRIRYGGVVFLLLAILMGSGLLDGIFSHFKWMPVTEYLLPYNSASFAIFLLYIMREQVRRERYLSNLASGLEIEVAHAVERAEVDPLTKCYNRVKMEQVMEEELARQVICPLPFSLIMLDIDHFKSINDTFGHDAGDVVLASFAARIRHNVKKSDMLIRWGGEEFIVYCRNCGLDRAAMMAERLRSDIEESVIFTEKKITCSVGVATWHGNTDTMADILKRVDNALYVSKETGRNRVSLETDKKPAEDEEKTECCDEVIAETEENSANQDVVTEISKTKEPQNIDNKTKDL